MVDAAVLFRALAEETRLYMLTLIRKHGELCVCDLENVLEITQSKASRHLRYLLNAGLVRDRRETVWIYYRIAESLDAEQRAILEDAERLLDPRRLAALSAKLEHWREHKKCGVVRDPGTSRAVISEVAV